MANLKQLLLNCQVYLQERDWDKLLETLEGITQEDFHSLDQKTAEECLGILLHLIKEAEDIRNGLANTLVNLKKFSSGYGP
ncbi:MAG: hypothetical protein RMK35_05215 [Aquificaceae bacterium]|nr:hypothetical protein [Aquificaceae bacterium]